jgi:hypothetical protein
MLGTSTSGSYVTANTSSTKLSFNPSTGALFANTVNVSSLITTANGTTGTSGQVLTSTGTGVYWAAASGPTINSQVTSYTLVASDSGKVVSITTGGVTIPNSVMSAGNIVTIYNNSGSSQTITQGTGVTLQWAGQSSSTTGNRTLGLYGIATLVYITASNAVISGAELT